ncbi:MAG: hypothetical protein IIV14_07815, partial [Bacteroidaceae bacterium]|nr:hypothetical protein [Bacteroidaceae bacterium]
AHGTEVSRILLLLHPVWQLPYVSSFHTVLLEAALMGCFFYGAGNRTRTGTLLRARDFKSLSLSRIFCPEMDNSGLFFHDISRKK